jgi:transposase InsO family protein
VHRGNLRWGGDLAQSKSNATLPDGRTRAGEADPGGGVTVPAQTLTIERANLVWAMDITYVPMARGFVYLPAVMDWADRGVLSCECRSA